jgi:hypothetical protein
MSNQRFNIPKFDDNLLLKSITQKKEAEIKKEIVRDKKEKLMLMLTVGLFIETLIIIVLTILLL